MQRLALRGKWEGLTPKTMARAYSEGDPSLTPISYQTMAAIVRQAEQQADRTVSEVIREARIEELMRLDGLTLRQANQQWFNETSA